MLISTVHCCIAEVITCEFSLVYVIKDGLDLPAMLDNPTPQDVEAIDVDTGLPIAKIMKIKVLLYRRIRLLGACAYWNNSKIIRAT